MQGRPMPNGLNTNPGQGNTNGPPQNGPRTYIPPIPPSVPPSIGQLIPRLRGAINDIDIFQNMVAQGAIDSSMPNWDALLRQYSLLTARLNALSTHLSTLQTSSLPSSSSSSLSSKVQPLDQSLITPLHPLPSNADPLAQGTYFEGLNTMPLLPLSEHINSLLSPPPPSSDSNTASRIAQPWKSITELRTMEEGDLETLRDEFGERLKSEKQVAESLSAYVEEQAGEYTWDTRVDEDAEEEEEDLFGENEDEDDSADKEKAKQVEKEKDLPNPRSGWKLSDYIGYMESGRRPL